MSSRSTLAGTVAIAALVMLTPQTFEARQAGAKATIAGDGISGSAQLREVPAQLSPSHDMSFMSGMMMVEITVTVSGLTPGAHGMHLHAVGKCEAPGFTTAGGHFDPGPSSNTDPDVNHPFHMGDLPNLFVDAAGKATWRAVTSRVTLGEGPLSLFDADGTALIIHANPDRGISGEPKSGVSGGPRIACGVITR